ncbi:hypothetical protein [Candidatus Similichlamydia epinepheli]|uniref:hypothetical protein n=1 Tax=Candidatus Similichlamydia epinepheli TaxID=1903953 RepID=UPI0013004668|nr:hypothetical protein [Candidatus Similichlamydia epinepheli]
MSHFPCCALHFAPLEESVYKQPVQKEFFFFSADIDLERSNVFSDVIPVIGSRFIEVSTFPKREIGQSNQIGAIAFGFNGAVHSNVALFGSCHVLFEPYRCNIVIGAPSFVVGGSYSFPTNSAQNYLLCFCEGVWGYYSEENLEGYLQAFGLNFGVSGGKSCDQGIGVGLACGLYKRNMRDCLLRPNFNPGNVFYCSPEISYSLGECSKVGSRCGVYLKQKGSLGREQQIVCPSSVSTRWELFYQVDLGDDLTILMSYIRSNNCNKFGNASLGLNLRI